MGRALASLLVAALAGAGLPAPGGAAPLPVHGVLVLDSQLVPEGSGFPQPPLNPRTEASFLASIQGGVGGPITGLTIPSSVFSTVGWTMDESDGIAAPVEAVLATMSNRFGSFTRPTPGMPLQGEMPLAGLFRICLFADCTTNFTPANFSFPLSVVGVAGATQTVTGPVNLTIQGAPWSTVSVSRDAGWFTEPGGTLHGPLSNTSSAASASGLIRLITPIFISTSIPGGTAAGLRFIGRMSLHVVPEPASLLLLGAGVGALTALGRSKRRR